MAKRRGKKPAGRWRLPKLPQWDLSWVTSRGTLVTALWVLGVGGLVTAWVLGTPRLEAYASAHQADGDVVVRLVDLPTWVEADLESMLVETAVRHIGDDPLQRADLMDAREALLATGWFVSVDQVRRVGTRVVDVTATLAEPFAVIRDRSRARDYLVDAHGRVLPRTYAPGERSGYIGLTGARYSAPTHSGMTWPGADVAAALDVLALISDKPWLDQVVRIDLSRHRKDGSIRLVTDRDCTIVWGRAPGDEAGSDVPASQKLSYLDYHYEQYGHIDRGLEELDITGDVVVGR